jgi:NADH-quinone oxidoreductase subunit J
LAAGLIFTALLIRKLGGPISAHSKGIGLYFWVFSAIAIVAAFRVVTHPRPVYSALYFVLVVMASAGLFILMWAEFMAVALIIIYAGAILITYVFVIMLAQQSRSDLKPMAGLGDYDAISREPLAASMIGFALMGVLLFVIYDKATALAAPPVGANAATIDNNYSGSTQALGWYLFKNQLVNLELAGLLLTVSMVGAIVIARRRVVAGEVVETPEIEQISQRLTALSDAPGSIPIYGTKNPRAKAYPES